MVQEGILAALLSYIKCYKGHYSSGELGSAFAMEPTTTSMGGSIACKPRAITVFAVPRFPEMAMPPIS